MIKLGMMARAGDEAEFENHIAFAHELGLDVIDFHLSGMPRAPDFLRHIKIQCLKHGLPIGYLGAGSFAGPESELGGRMEQGKADVDMAAFMGAQLIRVFARYKWPDTVEEQEALWAPMIARFQQLSDYAAEKGVSLGLQNHDNGSFAMTADGVLRILRETDRENFTFIMDTGQWLGSIGSHPRGEYDPNVNIYKDYLEPTAPYAAYVRAKIYKIDSGREEYLDYERILKILKTVNFNGNMSIVLEHQGRYFDNAEAMRRAVKYLHELLAAYA